MSQAEKRNRSPVCTVIYLVYIYGIAPLCCLALVLMVVFCSAFGALLIRPEFCGRICPLFLEKDTNCVLGIHVSLEIMNHPLRGSFVLNFAELRPEGLFVSYAVIG